MFRSRVDRFNIVDATPFKRDPVKELAAACAKRGIRSGVSLNLKVMSVERAARLEKTVRGLQTDCLISGRLGGDSQSDYASEGDNSIPNLSRGGAWETPATLNGTWGFKKNDHNWKKPETLIFKLAGIVSKGGNYLLNVGPDGEGVIPQPGQDVLRAVGRWPKVNGESIYGAGRSPFGAEFGEYSSTAKDRRGRPLFQARTAWRCTTRPGKLYLHLFQWPAGAFELKGVQGRAAKAYLLAGPIGSRSESNRPAPQSPFNSRGPPRAPSIPCWSSSSPRVAVPPTSGSAAGTGRICLLACVTHLTPSLIRPEGRQRSDTGARDGTRTRGVQLGKPA